MGIDFKISKDELKQYHKLYLYGAGHICRLLLHTLEANHIDIKFDAILVTDLANNPEELNNVPVIQYSS